MRRKRSIAMSRYESMWFESQKPHIFVQIAAPPIPNRKADHPQLQETVLDWAALEIPDYMHGKSLVPLLNGESVAWRDTHYTENILRDTRIDQRCIRTNEWKLILTRPGSGLRAYSGDHALYNLLDDPEEELNVYKTPRKDGHNQYLHFPPYTDVIDELANILKRHAQEVDDSLGSDLADLCLLEMQKRRERAAN